MTLVILRILNAMIGESRLPNFGVETEVFSRAIRKTSFDELQSFFQRYVGCRRDQQVKVIGHDDEFVEKKAALRSIGLEYLEEETGHPFGLEESATAVGDGGHEKGAVGWRWCGQDQDSSRTGCGG